MRAGLALFLLLLLVAGAFWWLQFEHHSPSATVLTKADVLGRKTPIDIDIHSDAPGLRTVAVRLEAGGTAFELFSESYAKTSWRGSGVTDKRIHVDVDLAQLKVPEGPATLQIIAETYGWHFLPARHVPLLSTPVAVDMTPPRVDLLTTQHNIRLGGVDVAVFRESSDTTVSGVQVEQYFFPAITGYFADRDVALGFFAIPQDLNANVRPRVIARDAAGNERSVFLPSTIQPREFSQRTLAVDDDFLNRKVPEVEHDNALPITADHLKGYLYINNELRRQNEQRIREVTSHVTTDALWDGAFHRQPNAAPLSSFADRRTYTYKGEVVDHQTHLGYDLASLKLSPVEAAQNGIVVFAGNLGIYGNAVIVDHGLGIFSLYGHLSSIAVQQGDRVKTGQTLGQTGETGLAGGDHLHFSTLLRGVHVDPVEWWDPHWLHDRVTAKLTMLPRASSGRAAGAPAAKSDAVSAVRESTPGREHEQARP